MRSALQSKPIRVETCSTRVEPGIPQLKCRSRFPRDTDTETLSDEFSCATCATLRLANSSFAEIFRAKQFAQAIGFHRFREVMVKARGERLSLVSVLSPTRNGNERDSSTEGTLANPASNIIAAHPRHTDVQEDNSWLPADKSVERLFTSVHDRNVMAIHLQKHCETRPRVVVVIRDEHPSRHRLCGNGTKRLFLLGGAGLSKRQPHDKFTALARRRSCPS